jgi:hypothetical protein
MALAADADHALDPTENAFEDQATFLTGDGFDAAFENSHAPLALRQALISRSFPLEQDPEALALACAKSGVVKVQFEMP